VDTSAGQPTALVKGPGTEEREEVDLEAVARQALGEAKGAQLCATDAQARDGIRDAERPRLGAHGDGVLPATDDYGPPMVSHPMGAPSSPDDATSAAQPGLLT
jgi:hypothetical protein